MKRHEDKLVAGVFGLGLCVVTFLAIAAVLAGIVMNVIALTRCDFKPSYKAEIIHTIGIVVPPVGAIVGWVGVEDVVD